MVSQLKSDTARINGAKSRGPTEGKEKSSRNAIKHGLTADNGNIPDQFLAEKNLVEEMVATRWRTRRLRRLFQSRSH